MNYLKKNIKLHLDEYNLSIIRELLNITAGYSSSILNKEIKKRIYINSIKVKIYKAINDNFPHDCSFYIYAPLNAIIYFKLGTQIIDKEKLINIFHDNFIKFFLENILREKIPYAINFKQTQIKKEKSNNENFIFNLKIKFYLKEEKDKTTLCNINIILDKNSINYIINKFKR